MGKLLENFLSFVFFVWEGEGISNEPIHVHVARHNPSKQNIKIWITEDDVEIAYDRMGCKPTELRKITNYVRQHRNDIIAYWAIHFRNTNFKEKSGLGKLRL